MAPTTRPIVFFDINIGETPAGRIKMELYSDIVPKTAENFQSVISCAKASMTGGDFLKGDGTGSFSIYGDKFPDENFTVKHDAPGLLSMANSGANTNGCQFFITTQPCDFLDGKHVVFGKVIDGMLTVRKIENVSTGPNNRPKLAVKITG
ncbi:Peptidyl-prolyl cis-trans isomerase H [Clathrus columnatus]|uniref:Peptidyl-prolyl cis-trans isomerase n=1 Tax=Clathrus columnatus TaxID=1419009 RepID=A0AAV5AMA9_9AGAM|nr:Peptidyl-prolyl cis-trans isomerase H [Clathrus columnatus]